LFLVAGSNLGVGAAISERQSLGFGRFPDGLN